MKIRLFGQRGILGGGVHYSNFSDALKKIHYIGDLVENIDVRNPTEFGQGVQTSQDNDVNIWFWQHPEIQHFKGVNVVWAIFESDKLPNYLIEYYQKYAKLLWVPSQWGKEVLINNGIAEAMIDVVPEGVDANQYHPYLRGSIDKKGEPFRFLSIGKFEERKGYRELLEAFKLAFDNSPEVELVIKADYFLDPENKKQQCVNLINEVGLTNVKLIWGELTTVQLFELYNFADVYVTATRAEGWGLPIIEAAATGLPIIAPFYSGHTEFLKHLESSVLKVEHQLVEIDDFEFKKFWPTEDQVFGKWAFTDIQKLAQKLKFISINAEEFSKDSILNASLIDKNFDWKNSVLIGLRSLLNNNILILR
jgi:glycosyltransferase involved in cell wall biosynthesis